MKNWIALDKNNLVFVISYHLIVLKNLFKKKNVHEKKLYKRSKTNYVK